MMMKPSSHLQKLHALSDRIGRYVPWLMIPLVLITFITAGLRYLLDYGHIGLQEVSTYFHAIILMLCMSYTFQRNEHVRIDVLYNRFSKRARALINLIGDIIFLLPLACVLLVTGFDYALRSWLLLEKSLETGGLPLVFILKSLIPLMALLLVVQACADIADQQKRLKKR